MQFGSVWMIILKKFNLICSKYNMLFFININITHKINDMFDAKYIKKN